VASTPFYPTSFNANINFQPSTVSTSISGYSKDVGTKYGTRSNGLKYGWTSDNTANMKVRNNSRSPDKRYDTFAQFTQSKKWEIAVPKGTYAVRYAVGDPAVTNLVCDIYVEGQFSVHERTTGHSYWIERSITVNVTDGKLTIMTPSGSTQKNGLD